MKTLFCFLCMNECLYYEHLCMCACLRADHNVCIFITCVLICIHGHGWVPLCIEWILKWVLAKHVSQNNNEHSDDVYVSVYACVYVFVCIYVQNVYTRSIWLFVWLCLLERVRCTCVMVTLFFFFLFYTQTSSLCACAHVRAVVYNYGCIEMNLSRSMRLLTCACWRLLMYLRACVHISVCFPTQLLVFVCVSGLAGRVFIKSNLLVNIENVFTHPPTLCSVAIVPSPQLVKRKEKKPT